MKPHLILLALSILALSLCACQTNSSVQRTIKPDGTVVETPVLSPSEAEFAARCAACLNTKL